MIKFLIIRACLVFVLSYTCFALQAQAYLYPVACLGEDVFYIYQKDLSDLELWRVHQGQFLEKCLDWRFMPAGFKLLPGKNGFSFIDSGRLRFKNFIKRSSTAIEFDLPVFNISEINWLDSEHCYFSAKQNNQVAIFAGNIKTGQLKLLYTAPGAECLSPRIMSGQLFWIERQAQDRRCSINQLDLGTNQLTRLIDCHYQQLINLQMLTPVLGFYIEHMPYIHDQSKMVNLICHKLELIDTDRKWTSHKLFEFQLPKLYLFGEERCYESVIPFFPRVKKTVLYFTDIKQIESKEYISTVFSYNLTNSKIDTILVSNQKELFFAPLFCQNKLFLGKIIPTSKELSETELFAKSIDL